VKARFEPAARLAGELVAPPDKSISHRAALLGAIVLPPVRISNYLHAADTTSTLEAVRALGAPVEVREGEVLVGGIGLRGPRVPAGPIDVGNAGTLMRLLPGWLAAQDGRSFTLDGDASIRRRPGRQDRRAAELDGRRDQHQRRALPTARDHGRGAALDLLRAARRERAGEVVRALCRPLGRRCKHRGEPARSRDHTERMLLRAGALVRRNGRHVTVASTEELALEAVVVPGDASSAAFWLTAGVLVPGARLVLEDVGVNWTRTGFLRILKRMGGQVLGALETSTGNSCGRARQRPRGARGPLTGTVVEQEEVPLAIDELRWWRCSGASPR